MRITQKLAVLVAVPLVAVIAFAALAIVTSASGAVHAEQLRRLVTAGAAAGEVVHALQVERAAAVLALTDASEPMAEAFADSARDSRRAAAELTRRLDPLPELPEATAAVLNRATAQLPHLERTREQVAGGAGTASSVAFAYRIVIADLIAFRDAVPQAGSAPAGIADHLRAASALSQANEHLGRQQATVLRAVAYGRITPVAVQDVTAARTGHTEATLAFDALATEGWRAWWEQSATGPEAVTAQLLQDEVARADADTSLRLDAAAWADAIGTQMRRARDVEARVDAAITADVVALRDGQRRLATIQSAAVAAVLVLAVGLAVGLGRPVVQGLRHLRDAAHRVAYQELPAAVARLDNQEQLGATSPDEIADEQPPPVRVQGRDELAEVGRAFNAVHREAVRTAAAQALLRLHVGAMFVNLARRGQSLAGRLTTALDEAERDERDPARLAQLFELDLLVTLLGRTNESLLVLGGASPALSRSADEPMASVLAAAQSQVEAYARVEIGVVDPGVAVRAAAVDDVVKMLAELIDNACTYSSPDSPVRVDARWLTDRVVVQVADQGIGLNAQRRAELNARLVSRPQLDVAAVRAMGLTVVGHIAARRGIRVELRPGHDQGTIAEVTLPPAVYLASRGAALLAPPGTGAAPPPLPASPPAPATPAPPAPSVPLPRRPEPQLVPADSGWPVAGRPPVLIGGPAPEPATQELPLPVFEQVRSRWFASSGGVGGWVTAEPPGDDPPAWHTTADAGWQAAARASAPETGDTTGRGLPKRRPGTQLVPGGVDDPAAVEAGDWRDPASVSASLAAFSRGLASGRAKYEQTAAPTEWSTP